MTASLRDVEEALDRGQLRQMGLVHTLLGVGPTIFLAVIVVLHLLGREPDGSDPGILPILGMVHGAMLVTLIPLSLLLPALVLRRLGAAARTPSGADVAPAAFVNVWLRSLSAVLIVRMALLEGPALFGNVVLLMAVLGGHVDAQPLYWLNAGTTGLLLLVTVATFPTRERVLGLFRRHALER